MSSDTELLERWCQGEGKAGEALIDRHYGVVKRFFANKVANPHDADDCVHETFVGCVGGKDRVRDHASFRSYLIAIACNVLRRYIGKKVKREREDLDFAEVCVHEIQSSLTSIITRHREEMLIVSALRGLPLEQQIALELNIFEELSGREIAELLGIPEGTVRGRLRLGKDGMRRRIAELSADARERESTITDLGGWAKQIRALIDGEPR